MKTKLFVRATKLLPLFLCSSSLMFAQQLKLGDNPSSVQKSALLELESKSQGLLLPRIADTTTGAITAAPDGMIIYLTLNNSLCIRSNGHWHPLLPEGYAITSLNGQTIAVQNLAATNTAGAFGFSSSAGTHTLNVPDATATNSGFVNTQAQTLAGAKTFTSTLTANSDVYLTGISIDNTKDSVLLIDQGKILKKQLTGLPPIGAAGGDLTGTYPSPAIAAGAVTGTKIAQAGATTGQVLKWNGTTWAPAADDNTGSISSIGITVPAPFTISPSTLTGNGTFTIGTSSQSSNTVYAAPNGSAGTPSFRSLVASDIPSLPFSQITGTVPVAQGGTGLTAVGANGTVLTSNGTTLSYVTPSVTLAGDVTGASGSNTIGAGVVSYSKIQDVTAQKILGRYAATAGSTQEISLDNTLKFATGGILYADSSLAIWNASKLQGVRVAPGAPATGQVLKFDGTVWGPAADNNTGLTSVGLTMPSMFSVSNSPLTANGTITTTLASQTANTVLAAPNGSAGTPSFRSLVASDIPGLPFSQITGTVPVTQGGTGLTAVGTNGQVLTSNGTSLSWATPTVGLTSVGLSMPSMFSVSNSPLTANGTITTSLASQTANTFLGAPNGSAGTPTFRSLVASDIPNLPFSQITGTVPVAQGGTGLTAVGTNGQVLTSNGTSLSWATPTVGLTSVGLSLPLYTLSNSPLTANGTLTGTLNSQTANTILAAPNGSAGTPTFRSLVASDIPSLPFSQITGTVPVTQGGTGLTAVGTNGQVLTSNGTSLSWATPTVGLTSVGLSMPSIFSVSNSPLTANGTISTSLASQTANTILAAPSGSAGTPTFRSLVASDIPSLPFSQITGTVPVTQGGTGLTAVGTSGQVLTSNGTSLSWATPSAGTVTSVALSLPASVFTVSGSPVTTSGTLTGSFSSQTASYVFAAPNGSAGTPSFRALLGSDIQNVTASKLLGRYSATAGSAQEVTLDNSIKLTTAGTLYADSSLAIWNASKLQGVRINPVAPTDNYVLKYDAGTSTWGPEVEAAASNWLITGNSNTTASNFLGTTVDMPMILKYNNNELFRGTKGSGAYYNTKTVCLFNGATAFNAHPVVIRANGPDVLAFQDSTGTLKWHWNMLGTGLNFVESNVADYRLFLQAGGNVGVNTGTPTATLDVNGTTKLESTLTVGASVSLPITSIGNGTTTLDATYYTVVKTSTGTTTVNLPAASSCAGRIYVVKRASTTGTLTVSSSGGYIDVSGTTSITIATGGNNARTFQSDGSNWYIIAAY